MILNKTDIYYEPTRDGEYPAVEKPATPVAFVIDGEVVYADGFSPPIGDNIFLANPTYTSRIENIDGVDTEVITATVGETSTDMILDEHFTAVLLSYPLAIEITRTGSKFVDVGWKHDSNGFYQMKDVDGVMKRIDGMGNVVE
jgi:hypothetical protein